MLVDGGFCGSSGINSNRREVKTNIIILFLLGN